MLAGFDGQLLSESFLEAQIADADCLAEAASARPRFEAWHRRARTLGPATSVRALLDAAAAPLATVLGFEAPLDLTPVDRVYTAALPVGGTRVALLVAPWGERLDPLWRIAVLEARRRSASWVLLFNGIELRLVDAARVYARRFVRFDMESAMDDPRAFAALWTTIRAHAFEGAPGVGPPIEALVSASERHASGVCRSLRDGVLAASGDLLQALASAVRPPTDAATHAGDLFEQALTLVYRILFLLFAEGRGLVPLWHPVYRESYSIDALRAAAEQPGPAVGSWDALRAATRLAHAGCRAGDLTVTPFNGRLFSPARTPLADRRDLDDEAARRAVLALATRPAPRGGGRERIAYRDLGVEQLGAVYETLLEYTPRVDAPSSRARRAPIATRLEPGSDARKATGTFYTPQPLAEYLVRRTLAPLVRDRPADAILRLRIVDPAMGSGAFLVAACRYLSAAYESALVAGGGYQPTDFGETERSAIRRLVAERCLYGVDLNPMAVQLARLSMWLATLAADRPLTFLDHRLASGDSLLGAWLADLRHRPAVDHARRRDDGTPLPFDEASVGDALRTALPVRFSIETRPDDTLADVRAKERALAELAGPRSALARWKRIADAWCAAWFPTGGHLVPAPAFGAISDRVLGGARLLPPGTVDGWLGASQAIAASRRFFHWELEFPEAFFDESGQRRSCPGFDAVIGNPPWEMMRADSGPAAARRDARAGLAQILRFTRDSGVYRAQSSGHANRYQLFLERAISLTRAGGRIGLVLPSGLATDHGSAALRRLLLTHCDVDALVAIDNHRGIFPIHRSVRFLLLTASTGTPTRAIACRFGVQDPSTLDAIADAASDEQAFPVSLTPALLERLSGPDLVVPDLRAPIDVTIVERATTLFGALGDPERGWGVRFARELNATDDRGSFGPPRAGLPVVEGKQLHPFRVDLASARQSIAARDLRRLLDPARYERPRLAYRDVASATNRTTLVAAILPARCVSTHTIFCLLSPLPVRSQYFLCGLFNSLVVNYLVRQRVTTHITAATIERLPIPRSADAPGAARAIAALARLLARRDSPEAVVRLNVLVARLYQLKVDELAHVLETFPLIEEAIRKRVLDAYATETRR